MFLIYLQEDLFLAASRFIILDHLKVSHCDATASNNTSFEDSVMKVEYIPIVPAGNNNEDSGSNEIKKDSSNRNSSPIEEDDVVNYYDKGINQKILSKFEVNYLINICNR